MNENELKTVEVNEGIADNNSVVKGALNRANAAVVVGITTAGLGVVSLALQVGNFVMNKISTKKARNLINKLRKENLSDEEKEKIIDELFTKYGINVTEAGVILQ